MGKMKKSQEVKKKLVFHSKLKKTPLFFGKKGVFIA